MLWLLLIACESERIDALEARQAELQAEIAALRAEVEALRSAPEPAAPEIAAEPDPALEAGERPPPTIWVSEADWDALRTATAADLGRFIPYRNAAGDLDGYRISGVRRGSVTYQVGLKNGDIVHALRSSGQEEWIKPGDPAVTPERLRALLDSPAVDVRITRRQETAQFTYKRGEEARPR